jgi:hypothetical protein
MKKQLMTLLAGVTLSFVMTSVAHAEWYVGLDATNLSYEVKFASKEAYDLNPARFKLGYIADSGFGVELQLLDSGDDSVIDGNGNPFQTESKTSWGLSGVWSSTNKKQGFYGSLGILVLDTIYTHQANNTSNKDEVILGGIGIGYYYNVSEKLKLTVDYISMSGEAGYTSFTLNRGDVDVGLDGFGLGLRYAF